MILHESVCFWKFLQLLPGPSQFTVLCLEQISLNIISLLYISSGDLLSFISTEVYQSVEGNPG